VADHARQLASVSEEVFEQGVRQWRIGLRCYVQGEAGLLREIALVAGASSPNAAPDDGVPSPAALASFAAAYRGRENDITVRAVRRAQAIVQSGDAALVGAVEIGALTLSAAEKLASLAPSAREERLSLLTAQLRADGALSTDDTGGIVLRHSRGWTGSSSSSAVAFAAVGAPSSEPISEQENDTPNGPEVATPDPLLSRVESLWAELREALQVATDAGLAIPPAVLSEMRRAGSRR
jgi:hypothetical protein